MPQFKNLKLNPQIISALEKKGYVTPTPIQAQAIPHILEGRDFLGIAQTGTGKTAAFSLPILDNLFKSNKIVRPNHVRTLILTPTRELASQIEDNVKLYGQDLNLKSGLIFGGVNVNPQIRSAKQGFDILVATPGRLLDIMNQGHIRLSDIEIFVLDEADRMLDMGFINDVKKIIAKLPTQRQTLFFSATMPKDVAKLADSILNNPIKVEITPAATTVERIEQSINFVEKANKPMLLKSIIKNGEDNDLFLVFSKTKHNANRISAFLEQNSIKAAPIHGNKSQSAREKALEEFKTGKIKVLVATDIAARGIDISGITHVINYDIPNDPESYVHRIGRTGRAGKSGIAISFCDNSEKLLLKDIEKIIKMKIPVDENHPLHGVGASESSSSSLPNIKRGNSGRTPSNKSRDSKPASKAPFGRKFDNKSREEKPLSYFAQTKKTQAQKEDIRGSYKVSFDADKKPKFGSEERKPRSNSRPSSGESDRNSDSRPPRPKFSTEGSKPRFGSDSRGERPRFNDDRRPSAYAGDKKPRFDSAEKPLRRGFSERKPSDFGGRSVGFGEERSGNSNDRPAYKGRSEGGFQNSKPRFAGSEDRRSNTYENKDRRSRFSSDEGSRGESSGRPARSGFGASRSGGFGDRNTRSDSRPSFGENRPRNEGRKEFGDKGRVGRAFAGKPSGFGGRPSGFGGKPNGFGGKPSGGRKPSRPTNK